MGRDFKIHIEFDFSQWDWLAEKQTRKHSQLLGKMQLHSQAKVNFQLSSISPLLLLLLFCCTTFLSANSTVTNAYILVLILFTY